MCCIDPEAVKTEQHVVLQVNRGQRPVLRSIGIEDGEEALPGGG